MGAVRRCKPGAADAAVEDWISGKESRDAPAPGATFPRRSVGAHRVQMHPGLVHFGDYDRASFVLTSQRYSFYRCKTEGAISAPFADVKSLVLIDPCVAGPDGSVRTL